MMRIGIITMYYYSYNYGGLLQAYALTRFLRSKGTAAEQISYMPTVKGMKFEDVSVSNVPKIKRFCEKIGNRIVRYYCRDRFINTKEFRETKITHSTKIYTDDNIKDAEQEYDVFITGSDQVWNPNCYMKSFFLSFVNGGNKIRASYAASLGVSKLSDCQRAEFKKDLNGFNAISVREDDAVEIIDDILGKNVATKTLDPVFLLSADEWDTILPDRIIKEPYIFCYFLGEATYEKDIAVKLSKEFGCQIVNIIFASNTFRIKDFIFGDIKIKDADPADFVSLIKHADFILTDSFHAVAFSCLYKKNFFVYPREGHPEMISRITSILTVFQCEERLCNTIDKQKYTYIKELINFSSEVNVGSFELERKKSINYLLRVLNGDAKWD